MKKEKMTCKKLLIEWMKEKNPMIVTHANLERETRDYALIKYGKPCYSPSTYHRWFCWLKEDDGALLKEHGLEVVALVEGSGKENVWRITQAPQMMLAM